MTPSGRLLSFTLGVWLLCAAGAAASAPMACPSALQPGDPKALAALCRAAEQGDPRAQHNLGQAYFLTYGEVENSFEQAHDWFHRAALQGLPQAQYALAILHLDNRGVRGTFPDAVAWLLKAAHQGHGDAQYLLGLIYAHGVPGTQKDLLQVERWLVLAAENGHGLAQEVLRNLRIKGLLPGASGAAAWAGERIRVSPAACTVTVQGRVPYEAYTPDDLEKTLATSAEQYLARMETCLRISAGSLGPGFVPMVSR